MLEKHTNLCYVVCNSWQCLYNLNVYFTAIIDSKPKCFGPMINVLYNTFTGLLYLIFPHRFLHNGLTEILNISESSLIEGNDKCHSMLFPFTLKTQVDSYMPSEEPGKLTVIGNTFSGGDDYGQPL